MGCAEVNERTRQARLIFLLPASHVAAVDSVTA